MKRSRQQREADRAMIAALHAQGLSQLEIAQQITAARPYSLSRSQIQFDLQVLTDRWREDSLRDTVMAKAEQLAKLCHLERECWQAWERSKQPAECITVEEIAVGKEKLPGQKTTTSRKGQAGDPALLGRILDCIDKRCRMLGLDAPTRQEITGSVGSVVVELPNNQRDGELDYNLLSVEELKLLEELCIKATPKQQETPPRLPGPQEI